MQGNKEKKKVNEILCVYRWSLLIGLIVVVGAAVAAWVFSPKGDNQTYASISLSYLTLPYLPCVRCGSYVYIILQISDANGIWSKDFGEARSFSRL